MDIGIIGLPGSGKTCLFRALSGAKEAPANFAPGASVEMLSARVLDGRLDQLAAMENSKKTTFAQVNVADVTGLVTGGGKEGEARQISAELLGKVREYDLLMVVLRGFENAAVPHPLGSVDPERDLAEVQSEMLVADLDIVERRVQKLRSAKSRTREERGADEAEISVLEKCRAALEDGRPVCDVERSDDDLFKLRSFQFLTGRRPLVVLNVGDEDLQKELPAFLPEGSEAVAARTEAELLDFEPAERAEFARDLGLKHPAGERILRAALRAAGRGTFFTLGPTEARAWLFPDREAAALAAGKIHGDMQRGFIRAEVIDWQEFLADGPWKKLKGSTLLREEGRDYPVRDGEVVNIKFNV